MLECTKCMRTIQVRAMDVEDFDLREPWGRDSQGWRVENCFPCPWCQIYRGGSYPMVRVRKVREVQP